MDEFLCVRELRNETADGRDTVKVAIGTPEKRNESEFACPFQVIGLENSELQYAYGLDCFQALILAMEGIRANLEKSGRSLTWIGGQKGDHGFPRFVPSYYGLGFSRHLDELIEGEIGRFAEKMRGES
jgi:hypothetical protein